MLVLVTQRTIDDFPIKRNKVDPFEKTLTTYGFSGGVVFFSSPFFHSLPLLTCIEEEEEEEEWYCRSKRRARRSKKNKSGSKLK